MIFCQFVSAVCVVSTLIGRRDTQNLNFFNQFVSTFYTQR